MISNIKLRKYASTLLSENQIKFSFNPLVKLSRYQEQQYQTNKVKITSAIKNIILQL